MEPFIRRCAILPPKFLLDDGPPPQPQHDIDIARRPEDWLRVCFGSILDDTEDEKEEEKEDEKEDIDDTDKHDDNEKKSM